MTDDRIIAIETRIAFYEKAIEELSAVIYEQQKEIDSLRHKFDELENFVSAQNSNLKDMKDESPPPHY